MVRIQLAQCFRGCQFFSDKMPNFHFFSFDYLMSVFSKRTMKIKIFKNTMKKHSETENNIYF